MCVCGAAESEAPPQELTQRCQAQHKASNDPRFLVPVLAGLSKDQVVRLMPQLVQLEAPALAAAVHRLLRVPSSASGTVSAHCGCGLAGSEGGLPPAAAPWTAYEVCFSCAHNA